MIEARDAILHVLVDVTDTATRDDTDMLTRMTLDVGNGIKTVRAPTSSAKTPRRRGTGCN